MGEENFVELKKCLGAAVKKFCPHNFRAEKLALAKDVDVLVRTDQQKSSSGDQIGGSP